VTRTFVKGYPVFIGRKHIITETVLTTMMMKRARAPPVRRRINPFVNTDGVVEPSDRRKEGVYFLLIKETYMGQYVYKVGRSDNLPQRTSDHDYKGSEVVFMMACNVSRDLERRLLRSFRAKFISAKGREYFIGDRGDMINAIIETVLGHGVSEDG
jgi:hypothetical protein